MKEQLYNDNCFNVFPTLEDESIDMILVDLPYGMTPLKWDKVIDMNLMWEHVKRVIKPTGNILMFGTQPFTTLLMSSNLDMWKYNWVWEKGSCTGFVQCNSRPMKKYEDIMLFGLGSAASNSRPERKMPYYPQGLEECNKVRVPRRNEISASAIIAGDLKSASMDGGHIQKYKNYPHNILRFKQDHLKVHPTAKPVALLEYLIKTYTLEGETVLDFTMGSGSTGVACKNTNREFIGIELDEKYFNTAVDRIRGQL